MRKPNDQDRTSEWLWGWDPTPGIVGLWALPSGLATVWRRLPTTGELLREEHRFRPWVLLANREDLAPVEPSADIAVQELEGPGELRFLASAPDGRTLARAIRAGAAQRLGRPVEHLKDLGTEQVLALSPEEQYLVATGRTYFRDLSFDHLHRLQLDLETTGLDPTRSRVFMVAVRLPTGEGRVLEAHGTGDRAEADLIERLAALVVEADPDVIENHNLHGFDLPFLERRAKQLGIPLTLGRLPAEGVRQRSARRGTGWNGESGRRVRLIIPGRELIDTLDAVRRYDFSTRELPGHGLKVVARHLGLAKPDREMVPGHLIYQTYQQDPDRVRRYATADVDEVAALARTLGGAAFALAKMVPRRYERLADAGAATGVIDPLLVRAYLRSGVALPAHCPPDGTPHSGAALHLFATGVAERVVKADVASLYPSLMRTYRIGPARDHLGVLLALVDQLVEQRLRAKHAAKAAPPESAERHGHEAVSAAMKLVVNSAYGYLAAGSLTRFADVHAANEVTRRGRETLQLICNTLAGQGVTLLEADTDGVYFSAPATWTEATERHAVNRVATLLPPLVRLEFEGRYAAMLSHEPKNYALLRYDGGLILRGVAFRSSRAEPFGEAFLRAAIARLLAGDVIGVRDYYLAVVGRLRRREVSTYDVSSRVRLTKSPTGYANSRASRRELPYEAMLASGKQRWRVGERVRVYRARNGTGRIVESEPNEGDPRDYDVAHYVRVLRETYAARLARAFGAEDFETLFADPEQPSLFAAPVEMIRPVLTRGLSQNIEGPVQGPPISGAAS